ncbi:MAG: NTP transferase domain-containing protein [Chloroflexi bacterium]|nr:NTP transferase domain-containing protein [Chloroflexota bacterium]
MRSALPKILHCIAGRPMIQYVVDAALSAGAQEIVVIVGNQGEAVRETLGRAVSYAEQREQLGTGHALFQARDALAGRAERILVLCGDMPLVSVDSLNKLAERQRATRATVVVLTCSVGDPVGLGRIVRDEGGRIARIVEEKEATEAERAIREINTGVYCFDSDWLWPHLAILPTSSVGEFYLTDTIAMARAEGRKVESIHCADASEALGINNRVQLAEAETNVRRRVCARLMLEGVTIVDPDATRIDAEIRIGTDTVVFPGTSIEGRCEIGANCRIGPEALIRDSVIGDGATIVSSRVEGAGIAPGATVGPFASVSPGLNKTNFGNR